MHVKDPVVHTTVWWITETRKTPSMYLKYDNKLMDKCLTGGHYQFIRGKEEEQLFRELHTAEKTAEKAYFSRTAIHWNHCNYEAVHTPLQQIYICKSRSTITISITTSVDHFCFLQQRSTLTILLYLES